MEKLCTGFWLPVVNNYVDIADDVLPLGQIKKVQVQTFI